MPYPSLQTPPTPPSARIESPDKESFIVISLEEVGDERYPSFKFNLKAGIFTISAEGKGVAAFSEFRSTTLSLAKSFGRPEVELLGIAVTNKELAGSLGRIGFTEKTLDVPPQLGGGQVGVLSRTYKVR